MEDDYRDAWNKFFWTKLQQKFINSFLVTRRQWRHLAWRRKWWETFHPSLYFISRTPHRLRSHQMRQQYRPVASSANQWQAAGGAPSLWLSIFHLCAASICPSCLFCLIITIRETFSTASRHASSQLGFHATFLTGGGVGEVGDGGGGIPRQSRSISCPGLVSRPLCEVCFYLAVHLFPFFFFPSTVNGFGETPPTSEKSQRGHPPLRARQGLQPARESQRWSISQSIKSLCSLASVQLKKTAFGLKTATVTDILLTNQNQQPPTFSFTLANNVWVWVMWLQSGQKKKRKKREQLNKLELEGPATKESMISWNPAVPFFQFSDPDLLLAHLP